MFVDGKSIKWERGDGRPATVDDLLRAAVQVQASDWGNRDLFGFSAEKLEEWIWSGNLPTPEELDADADIPALVCSAIRRGSGPGCYYCGANRRVAEAMHIDHIRPRLRGGSDRAANKVRACEACNLHKSAVGIGAFRERMSERYDAETLPTFFGELPKARRVLGIETQTVQARHPNLKPAQNRPLSRMGTAAE